MSINPGWIRSSSNKKGLLGMALAMLMGSKVAGVDRAAVGTGHSILSYLDNAWKGQPLNGGHGRGNNARILRAAKRRNNIRKRSKGAAQGNTASDHGGRKWG